MSEPRSPDPQTPLSYRDSGVDIDAGNAFVERIKPIVKKTFRREVLSGLGGFGGLFALPLERYREPVLVSATDGVGTKLKLALQLARHDTIGIDLVGMCVNDVAVTGAEPLFFLDYFATGHLDLEVATEVVRGIAKGCELAGASLIGGETAEMPGMYASGDYDLAGFCVGIVERRRMIEPSRVRVGDALIGMASSGPHANGYSLIRRILEVSGADLTRPLGPSSLGDALLAPTRIYVKSLLALGREVEIHALAHITGGGLPENLPRVLPKGTRAAVDVSSWERPAVFRWLQERGRVEEAEMLRTFNCGVGMAVCVDEEDAQRACDLLTAAGERIWIMGRVESAPPGESGVAFR